MELQLRRVAQTAAQQDIQLDFDKALVDGYAIAVDDRSPTLREIELVTAGGVPSLSVAPGNTIRVMTGAPLPADTAALKQAAKDRDSARLQKLLDPHVLVMVDLSPEARVKARRGPAKAVLQQGGYMSEYDAHVSNALANVLCGGDLSAGVLPAPPPGPTGSLGRRCSASRHL